MTGTVGVEEVDVIEGPLRAVEADAVDREEGGLAGEAVGVVGAYEAVADEGHAVGAVGGVGVEEEPGLAGKAKRVVAASAAVEECVLAGQACVGF